MMGLFQTGRTGPLDLRGSQRRVAAMLAATAAMFALTVPPAQAGTANAGLPGAGSNPIAQIAWGVPHNDDLWNAYVSASAVDRALLARLALEPRAVWLGYWDPTSEVSAEAAATVVASQNGNPSALTEFATFELHPWENQTAAGSWNVGADEAWYRNLAAGIGSARALVIEQADLPFALQTASTAPEQIDTYAARVLSEQPHTTVYIDGGTDGWLSAAQDASLLIRNGVRYARGFALNDTDYDPTADDDRFGARVVAALAKRGVEGKHFIVNTDENGQPYGPGELQAATVRQAPMCYGLIQAVCQQIGILDVNRNDQASVPGEPGLGTINEAPMCHGLIQTVCQRTGIPPTTNVAARRWDLPAGAARDAERYCDAYVWSGRPWDIDAGPFVMKSAMWLAANGEY